MQYVGCNMTLWERFMQRFKRNTYDVASPPAAQRDALYPYAHEAYNQEKEAALQALADKHARLKRLGYDVDIVTRRDMLRP